MQGSNSYVQTLDKKHKYSQSGITSCVLSLVWHHRMWLGLLSLTVSYSDIALHKIKVGQLVSIFLAVLSQQLSILQWPIHIWLACIYILLAYIWYWYDIHVMLFCGLFKIKLLTQHNQGICKWLGLGVRLFLSVCAHWKQSNTGERGRKGTWMAGRWIDN